MYNEAVVNVCDSHAFCIDISGQDNLIFNVLKKKKFNSKMFCIKADFDTNTASLN